MPHILVPLISNSLQICFSFQNICCKYCSVYLIPKFLSPNFRVSYISILRIYFGSLYIFAYFQISIFQPIPYIPIRTEIFLNFLPSLKFVHPSLYERFTILDFKSILVLQMFYLTIIFFLYFKIVKRIIWRLHPNQSEKCKYNLISVDSTRIRCRFLRVYTNGFF